jgi:hypothetical protein
MTTSFALLVRGDLLNSLRANSVGTLLGSFCLALIPWALVSVARKKALGVRSLEHALIAVVLGLLVLMTLRWCVVVGALWWGGTTLRI